MANRNIVQERGYSEADASGKVQGGPRGTLVSTIMADVQEWRRLRDDTFSDLWDEFYAKWRGFWMPQHKSSKSERSKLISPLTSMSVDLTVSEIAEAVLGRENFLDLPDDVEDKDRADMEAARNRLVEDLWNCEFDQQICTSALSSALYGNGIMKVQILVKTETKLIRGQNGALIQSEQERVLVKPLTIDPSQFVPDPSVPDIDDMKGCAHEFPMALHTVKQRQADGIYYKDCVVMPYTENKLLSMRGDTDAGDIRKRGEYAFVTEYYGLVPTREYLAAMADGEGQAIPESVLSGVPETQMTEVIATIANEGNLLRVIENPNPTGERLVASFQHETVPNRFWGRGVCEKASNVQRAMDSEMRARIDSLAWANNPMFAGDLTRMPPNSKLNAWPGKFWGTRGNPSDVIQAFKIPGPDGAGFQHMADLERMGQQATGALDSIMSLRSGVRDETATGSSLSAAGFIKRSKRTMRNIETFLRRVVRRTLHVKMKYEPKRYPVDYDFQVRGTVGMMAREIEQQHLMQILHNLGAESPIAPLLVREIIANSSVAVRESALKALDEFINRKPSPEEEQAKKAQLALPVAELRKTMAEAEKLEAEADKKQAETVKVTQEAKLAPVTAQLEAVKVANDLEETINQSRQLDLLEDKNDIERQKVAVQARSKK